MRENQGQEQLNRHGYALIIHLYTYFLLGQKVTTVALEYF